MTLLEVALQEYGLKEIPGEYHNPKILRFFDEIGHEWVDNDETAWCSAFINWCCKQISVERSGKLDARSWLKVGNQITVPVVGDIVVFWRDKKDSWKGHVGIFINDHNGIIETLGGNQNNSVCIKPYPKDRLLGYRRLRTI